MKGKQKIYSGLGPVLIIIVILVLFLAHFHVPNSGQHTGYVSSVEESGIIWKTWTAYIKTDPQSSQEDAYCVTDPTVVSQLQTASENRTLVTVNYSSPMIVWKWSCGGEQSIIDDVQSTNNVDTNQPATSVILDKATSPNYNGADLVNLRLKCANQAQSGFSNFVQFEKQIENSSPGLVAGTYSLGQFHFNEKLATCLIVVDNTFNSPNMGPSDTTYLVNVYENQQVMNCTSYGDPVNSRLCYDDSNPPIGKLVSYDDWLNIFNQYMNQ